MSLSEGTDQCDNDGWLDFPGLGFESLADCRLYFNEVYDNRLTDFVDD